MRNQKMYEADDKMISLIADNYNLLESLGRFGINLGFGDKTVKEVCEDQGVDTYTFLAVVNYSINGYRHSDDNRRMSVPTLLHYLKASHEYYLDFQLPDIRQELKIIKTITVEKAEDFKRCEEFKGLVDCFLFQGKNGDDGYAGKFDWNLLDAYQGELPFLLSGDVAPEDAEAVKAVKHPKMMGVDINLRCERELGIKDVDLVRNFMEVVKA